jgi:Mn2+/Fe2+ NRAMP family transporter
MAQQHRSWWRAMGAGLVAAASDNDPTTVGSLSVIGASTGFQLLWLVVLVIPMLAVVQVISGSIGVVCRQQLQKAIERGYGKTWSVIALVSVVAVSTVTLAADLEGGAAALELISHLAYRFLILPLALAVGALLVLGSYRRITQVLRYLLLVFVAYIGAAFLARPDWLAVLRYSFVPHFSLSGDVVAGALALLGTTLTSYAYYWESIEESEEHPSLRLLPAIKLDAALGMVGAGIIFWFIIVTTAATIGAHHGRVETAEDAARALVPFAGRFASLLFGIGLLASALLAVPVLAATNGYAAASVFGWRAGLDLHYRQGRAFYNVVLGSLVIALVLTLAGVAPIRLLFISSILGGLGTPITLGLMMLVARNRKVMHGRPISLGLAVAGWCVTAIVCVVCALFLWQTFFVANG